MFANYHKGPKPTKVSISLVPLVLSMEMITCTLHFKPDAARMHHDDVVSGLSAMIAEFAAGVLNGEVGCFNGHAESCSS